MLLKKFAKTRITQSKQTHITALTVTVIGNAYIIYQAIDFSIISFSDIGY